MKPPPFTYHSPSSVEETLDVLAETGTDGKVLAGGQSLIPLMNMRLAAPAHLIDINGAGGLDVLRTSDDGVRVGATVRQARVERDAEVFRVQPLLRWATGFVAHPVVRNRGTVVGSLAHADPAGELPAVLALLDGTIEVVSRGARRTVTGRDFFAGPLESSLEPDELAVSAFFPALPDRAGASFAEVARRHGDFAVCGAAGLVELDDDLRVAAARVAYVSVGPNPVVLDLTEACGHRSPGATDWTRAADAARGRLDPGADIHASAEYRRHLAGVLTARVLGEAGARAHGAAASGDGAHSGALR
ncbi:MAG: xanthine dehydrogenase family protein subunit M [Streptosporangiales bacterium]|nr:xanthine dehydrogenase family protein subunit M [Streptosporangiales bacterium]